MRQGDTPELVDMALPTVGGASRSNGRNRASRVFALACARNRRYRSHSSIPSR